LLNSNIRKVVSTISFWEGHATTAIKCYSPTIANAQFFLKDGIEVTAARKPIFFIIGAPKCGTTSLATWLSEHPNVFMSAVKEPHFFNTDDRRFISTLEAYENLFRDASRSYWAVGEASVSSTEAVQNILKYQPDARFIVMVRNPVEMAPALHAEMLVSGHENVHNFSAAWHYQEERRQGRQLPPLSWARRRFLYGDVCKLGAQLERLLSTVPASRVLAIVLDDISADTRGEYLRVLRFLGLKDDGRPDFAIYNKAKKMRWPSLTRVTFDMIQIKGRIGVNLGLNLLTEFPSLTLSKRRVRSRRSKRRWCFEIILPVTLNSWASFYAGISNTG